MAISSTAPLGPNERLNVLHRPYLMRTPPILPPPERGVVENPSRERCIDADMELVRVLCDAHEEAARWSIGASAGEQQVSAVLFHYAYCAFASRWIQRRASDASIAARALTILAGLRKAGGWNERFGRRDGAPLPALRELAPVPAWGSPFNSAQFGGFGFAATSAAISFLNAGRQVPEMSSFARLQSAVMNQETGLLDLGTYMSLMALLPMDPSWRHPEYGHAVRDVAEQRERY
ncbi:hypothetical protein GSI_11724 [Ganoderma sinense ZZ0214-1]|uniref:Uncharacterized protein n=1 Tax=Ganoderma sinense ZZ0214-1 TaxID=1077348 RepID=A0A2G8RWT1_9APHY|nr:hypothetical protein GSI_11724 [Ganoderma sinense ZZ0214-1]